MSKNIAFHLICIGGATIVLVAAMFLPFLPGDFDAFAVTLSAMVQLFGISGLILVPIGALWLTYEWRRHRSLTSATTGRGGFRFGVVALIAGLLVMLIVSASAAAMPSVSLGVILLALSVYVGQRLISKLRQLKTRVASAYAFNPAPLHLIMLPAIVALGQFLFMDAATESSRRRAIAACERLIRDIEKYHGRTGHYPPSLLSVWKDYRPRIIGISGYNYELNGKAYNVSFEQFTARVGTREIVMFNKLGQHTMTSHDQDLLEFAGEQLNRQRGFYEVVDAPVPHWKCFRFD